MKNIELKITITGFSQSDLEEALKEILRLVRGGHTSGFNENAMGSFDFEVNDTPAKESK